MNFMIIDLAILGLHSLLNQVQYHKAIKNLGQDADQTEFSSLTYYFIVFIIIDYIN